jgi:tuftelin-interacting protein 11
MSSSEDESDGDDFTSFNDAKRRRRTKDEALYGIFADDDDDNDSERRKTSKAYAKPVSFVSTGEKHEPDKHVDDVAPIEQPSHRAWNADLTSFGKKPRPKQTKRSKTTTSGSNERLRAADTRFEKYTKGIGSKLMAKMGYKGGGIKPVEVKVRPKGMGLGFGSFQVNLCFF